MGVKTRGAIVTLGIVTFALSSADLAEASPAAAAAYVQRIDLQALQHRERSLPPHERVLIGLYMEAAKRDVLDARSVPLHGIVAEMPPSRLQARPWRRS